MREPRDISRPQPGFWLIRLARAAVRVPACIRRIETAHEPGEPTNKMERSGFLVAEINGEIVDIDRVWLVRGEAITEHEYRYRVAVTDWAITHSPDDPAADATKAIDLNKLRPLF